MATLLLPQIVTKYYTQDQGRCFKRSLGRVVDIQGDKPHYLAVRVCSFVTSHTSSSMVPPLLVTVTAVVVLGPVNVTRCTYTQFKRETRCRPTEGT